MGWEWGQGGGDWFGQSIGCERTFGEGVWDLIMEVLGCRGLYLGGQGELLIVFEKGDPTPALRGHLSQ